MANDKEMWKYGLLGGFGALVTTKVLAFVSKWLNTGGYLDVDLQSIATIKTQGLGSVINPGLNTYFGKLLDVANINFSFPQWAMLFIGGALFGLLGYFLVNWAGGMKIKSGTIKTSLVFITASLLTTMLLAWKLDVPAMSALIPLIINSVLLAFVATLVLMFAGVEKNI